MNKVVLDNLNILEELNDLENKLKKKVDKLRKEIDYLIKETDEYNQIYKRILDRT